MTLTPRYTVELIEKDGQHFYCVDKDPTFLPGVTGILNASHKYLDKWAAKEASAYWRKIVTKVCFDTRFIYEERFFDTLEKRAKKQHIFTKDRAASLGNEIHALIDDFLKVKNPAVPTHLKIPCQSFLLWCEKENPKFFSGDQATASKIHGYGGSFDALIEDPEDKERVMVVDFKTGSRLYDTHGWQCAAYSYALSEQHGLNYLPKAILVRLGKDKVEAEQKKIRDIEDSFQGFKACLDLTRAGAIIQFEERKIFRLPKIKKIKEKIHETARA